MPLRQIDDNRGTMPDARHLLLQDTALRYFHEVAQCGSLTEASARLHVAASAISRQIAALEARLGAGANRR